MVSMNYSCTPVQDLNPYAQNARAHSDKQIQQVAKSIRLFGFINPVVIDASNEIVAGHCRVLAARQLGLFEVPTIQVTHLSEAELRAYRIADNKLTDNSEWDEPSLRLELEYLSQIEIDLDVTGFEIPEIDLLLASDEDGGTDLTPESLPNLPVTSFVEVGDCFSIGKHRLICGDCCDPETLTALMDGRQADVVCCDPPYNVKINGHVLVREKAHQEFAMASGELSKDEFIEFLTTCFRNFHAVSKPGSIHFHFMDWRHMGEILAAGDQVYDELLNLCVWAKTNAGMGSLYRSQHELVFVFKKGAEAHTNNVRLGIYGRNRSNLWTYAGMNSFGADRDKALSYHPTVKPQRMIADALMDVSHRGQIVLDGFLGSGTTLLAAQETGRICFGCEIDTRYAEVALERFSTVSEEPIFHCDTGLTLQELKDQRHLAKQEETTNE